MKLDVNVLRYLSKEEFRVLTAVEMGQKNHEIVPTQLISQIAGLKHGGAYGCLKTLLRHKLVHHENTKYDGYRLTYMGYDFLAIKTLANRGHIASVGRQVGVGKESDIFEVSNDEGEVLILKLHRLGRTSFRAVKNQRDYLGHRQNYSWLYLSRLAALKEYAFMKALGDHGLPVPHAVDNNRHAVLMTRIDGHPLVQVRRLAHPGRVYHKCMELISALAQKGLIHCDFNEFNLLVDDEEHVTLIDFPQMVSVRHANGSELFDRDVDCIVRFFKKKIGYMPEEDPRLPYIRPDFSAVAALLDDGLDVELAASGFNRQCQAVLEEYTMGQREKGSEEEEEEEEEEDEEEEEEASTTSEEDPSKYDPQPGAAEIGCASTSRSPGAGANKLIVTDGEGAVGPSLTCGTRNPVSAVASLHLCSDDETRGGKSSEGDEVEVTTSGEDEEGSHWEGAEAAGGPPRGHVTGSGPGGADVPQLGRSAQSRLHQQHRKATQKQSFSKASRNAVKSKSKSKSRSLAINW